jgi:hypothetical protein
MIRKSTFIQDMFTIITLPTLLMLYCIDNESKTLLYFTTIILLIIVITTILRSIFLTSTEVYE